MELSPEQFDPAHEAVAKTLWENFHQRARVHLKEEREAAETVREAFIDARIAFCKWEEAGWQYAGGEIAFGAYAGSLIKTSAVINDYKSLKTEKICSLSRRNNDRMDEILRNAVAHDPENPGRIILTNPVHNGPKFFRHAMFEVADWGMKNKMLTNTDSLILARMITGKLDRDTREACRADFG